MKYLICGLCFLMLVGCGDTIDFTRERTILSKITTDDIRCEYSLSVDVLFADMGEYIIASPDFAKVGDKIMYEDGVIKVIKKKK